LLHTTFFCDIGIVFLNIKRVSGPKRFSLVYDTGHRATEDADFWWGRN
jgi:hypothetical protein